MPSTPFALALRKAPPLPYRTISLQRALCSIWVDHWLASQHIGTTTRRSGHSFANPCVYSAYTSRKRLSLAASLRQPAWSQLFRSVPVGICTMEGAQHSRHSTAVCRAYVGEATPAAAEYHCSDFDWEELKQEAEAMLAERGAQVQVTACIPIQYTADTLLLSLCLCEGCMCWDLVLLLCITKVSIASDGIAVLSHPRQAEVARAQS